MTMGQNYPAENHEVTMSVADGVATLILNRPDAGNALGIPLATRLFELVEQISSDPTVRCLLLTGSGRFFCVGGDIKRMIEAGDGIGDVLTSITEKLHATVSLLLRMDKPVVVAVNGPVAGGGLGLALSGDIVIASASAHFSTAYAGIGFSPDGGSTWLLPRLVGRRRAQELLLTKRRVAAEEAVSLGLISRMVPDSELESEAQLVAKALADGPTSAFAATRRLLLSSGELSPEDQMHAEAISVCTQASGLEGREGIAAFVEKRSPDFAA